MMKVSTMPSDLDHAYVWTWRPDQTEPVVAGIVEAIPAADGHVLTFAYGQSYVERDAPALYLPELPVRRGRQEPPAGLSVAGVIRDAAPDAWGQRVIMRRLLGRDLRDRDPVDVPLLTYLLESGSDRPGALDFQTSPDTYVPRTHHATLGQLLTAADGVQSGAPVRDDLLDALEAGSSAGGARPKATLADGDRYLIAKFSTVTDSYPVMKAEAVAMDLARLAGLDAAPTELVTVDGRDVLLVERFDRGPGGTRRQFVSALTVLGLPELLGRYATYHDLADQLRSRCPHRAAGLRELFGRIVFNILVGNTDDHARNHAMFNDGHQLELTPAYDICPQPRVGEETAQAMAIGADGDRRSQVATCVAAAHVYELDEGDARDIIDQQLTVIHDQWADAADRARLTAAERRWLWGRQIVNPYATYGYT
jgi:serine/threonine-protein kinase HipA